MNGKILRASLNEVLTAKALLQTRRCSLGIGFKLPFEVLQMSVFSFFLLFKGCIIKVSLNFVEIFCQEL